jgi:hypothetical protein
MPVITGKSTFTGAEVKYWQPYFAPWSGPLAWIPGVLNVIYYTILLLWITFWDTPKRLITGKKIPTENKILAGVELVILAGFIYAYMNGELTKK